MKGRDNLDKATQDWIKIIELFYDLLDAGKSVEELMVGYDIGAAGGAIPEELRQILHDALEEIAKAREAGLNRSEVLAHMRASPNT